MNLNSAQKLKHSIELANKREQPIIQQVMSSTLQNSSIKEMTQFEGLSDMVITQQNQYLQVP